MGGGTGLAVTVAIGAGVIAGGIGLCTIARFTGRARRRGLEKLEEARGLILWARVRTPDLEEKAVQIMQDHGARAVRVRLWETDESYAECAVN